MASTRTHDHNQWASATNRDEGRRTIATLYAYGLDSAPNWHGLHNLSLNQTDDQLGAISTETPAAAAELHERLDTE